MSKFTIKTAQPEDMPFILSLAREEGWNPGMQDAVPFNAADPKGFFIGELNGKKIGCISAIGYSKQFGFIGLYIVLPDYRGQGWGLKLWNHAMAYLGQRTIGLDGVVAQQDNYKKSGFTLYHNNIRFEAEAQGKPSSQLTDVSQVPFETLLAYDTPIFGVPREIFLRKWISQTNARGVAKMTQNRLQGYGIIRSCHKGYKIGPLFADTSEIAKELYQALLGIAAHGPVYLDVSTANPESIKLAEKANLKKVFETARMYTGTPPRQDLSKLFGVTTFELG